MYDDREGVLTDSNGLLYMRARYYSPDMRRFVNADILAGKISNAITLNRYAYANGNPVSNIDPLGLSADERWKTVKDIYAKDKLLFDSSEMLTHAVWLGYGHVHFEQRTVNGVDKIIIFGKNVVTHSDSVDIPQRIINADNLSNYPNIGKYIDGKIAVKDAFSSYTNVIKGTAKASDYIGVVGDIAGVVLETGYAVSQYDDTEDKIIVGAYTAVTQTVSAVASTAASAATTALATTAVTAIATKFGSALGTAIAPGVGTAIGFLVGLGVGALIGVIADRGKKEYIDKIVENN